MKITEMITALNQALADHGDIKVLLSDQNLLGKAYDINRGDVLRANDTEVLVLVPNIKHLTKNSAVVEELPPAASENQSPDVQLRKGFIQVNITGYVWQQHLTEEEKSQPDAQGDFIEIEPIRRDIMYNPSKPFTINDIDEIPQGVIGELLSVLSEVSKIIRVHTPDPNKLMRFGTNDNVVNAPKLKLIDPSGAELEPNKN